ncbi:MAG TPA: type II toxin-antitoxin system VapC family toxin [Dehalococcoidia bacterium]|nr:type II toxin-antitoxin system VapC family toxin [Dehalococcoidia bacterium]
MKLIDANVFIYAVGQPHAYKDSCIRLLAALERGEEEGTTDVEVFQEVVYYFWRRRDHPRALAMFDRLLAGFPDPLAVTVREARMAREILEAYPHLQPRDAIHAAVVLSNGLEGIISTDRGFDPVPGLTRFDPREL